MFDAVVTRSDGTSRQRLVLRKEVPDPAVYPQQVPGLDVEIDIQYRCMSAIAQHSNVPVAPLIGYESDAALLGAPFFVMGFVGGDVPTESPPYTESGFFVDASPEQRRQLVENGLRTLVELHRLDWRAAGLEWLAPSDATPGTARQLDVWESYARRELGDRKHPLLEDALAWLHAHLPRDGQIGFCWGDPRPGNIIWNDFTPVCVTDFEAASIASPVQDLAWWLMFDRTMHPDGTRLPGDIAREEQRDLYATLSGRDLRDLTFHEIFAGARYAAIVVRVMNRLVARGDLPAEQTIWLENPATVCLSQMLEELT
jgi:aminoglycoside phosphotransferase (APT) family kinase protein